jgi:hypothetical protein
MAVRDGNGIVYRGWTGGEYGDLDPVVASRNPRQMFTAKNLMLYRTGLIGPRPGLVDLGLSSAPTAPICGMDTLAVGDGAGPFFWVMSVGSGAANVKQARLTTGSFTSNYGGASAGLTGITKPVPNGGSYGSGTIINVYEKGIYALAHGATKTFTNVSTTLGGGTAIGFATSRFVLNGSDGTMATGDSRMYFSGVFPGWGTYAALNYYDIGAIEITMMRPFRDGLLIGNNVGELWYMTGVLGTNAQLRRLTRAGAPAFESRGVVLKGNEAVYMNPNCSYPSTFNGAIHEDLKHLKFTGNTALDDSTITPGFRVSPMPWGGPDDYAIFSGQAGGGAEKRALLFSNGVHTYHTFEQATSAWVVSLGDGAATNNMDWTFFVIASNDGNGKFWKWAPSVPFLTDRPGFASDVDNSPGDASTTPFDQYLTLPVEVAPDGARVRVQQVIIDYVGWNTGASGNNRIKVQVDALYRWDGDATASSTELTVLDSAGSNFSTAGTRRRAVAMVGDQGAGGAFQIKLSGLRGVAIESVTAVLADEVDRP